MAIVWPCPLTVDAYADAGRAAEVPRPDCPSCGGPMVFWSGYLRYVRAAGRCRKIFIPRVRCGRCGVSHALLPAFALAWRLDTAGVIGTALARVAGGCGVRQAAERAGVPYTTVRGWWRRFTARGLVLGTAFAALAVDLGGPAMTPPAGAARFAADAVGAAFTAACGLPGWAGLDAWRFASAVTGGTLIAANTISPWLVVGRRRFMPPIPLLPDEGGTRHG
jgi:Domain of unknown function (DUF6431)